MPAINCDHHKDDDRLPERKYPRSSSIGRSSERGRLIEAITDQIELNKVAAKVGERDEQNKVGAEAMQANSATLRGKGDASVQGGKLNESTCMPQLTAKLKPITFLRMSR